MRRRLLKSSSNDFVDLGLPSGTLWAKGNICKNSSGRYYIGEEAESGVYVTWGNIDGYNRGEGYSFSSTNYNSTTGKSLVSQIASNDAAHDIALARLGNPWHLPTKEDCQELYDNTDTEWVANYNSTGVAGRKFMKKTDHSVFIFMPKHGVYEGSSINSAALYWTASYSNSGWCYMLSFWDGGVTTTGTAQRYYGLQIRPVKSADYSTQYFTITSLDNSNTISISSQGSSAPTPNLYYSTDNGATWTNKTSTGSIATLTNGQKLLIKSSMSTFGYSASQYLYFYSLKNVDVSGNIMSLIGMNNFFTNKTLTEEYVFNLLFSSLKVVNAENLVLPATTITKYCYLQMFKGRTTLLTAPKILPAMTMKVYCYNGMFYGCTNLTVAPVLPAININSEGCYSSMFYNCSTLNYIKAMFTTTPPASAYSQYTLNWVSGVASRGTFVKNANATWTTRGTNGVPSNWTIELVQP